MFDDRPIRDGVIAVSVLVSLFALSFALTPHERVTFHYVKPNYDTCAVGPTIYINRDGPRRLRKFGFSNYHIARIMYLRSCGYAFHRDSDLLVLPHVDTAFVLALSPRLDFSAPDSLGDVAELAAIFRRYTPYDRTWDDGHRYADRPAYSPRIPFFAADSATMAEAGMTPDAWDTLSAYQRSSVIRGSMALDSLIALSAADLSAILRKNSTPRASFFAQDDAAEEVDNFVMVDINVATREQLIEVRGIGDKTADAIIDLRRRLGGYVDVGQIKDLWTFADTSRYDAVAPYLTVAEGQVKPINVNSANDTRLRRHPYFPVLVANRIQQMRLQKGGRKLDRADIEHCIEGVEVSEFFWEYVSY